MHFFSNTDIKKLEKHLWVRKTLSSHEKQLWKKTMQYSSLFSKIPGILCVCVWNSLAMNASHTNSDIDLFIITKKKRIWTARILLTIILTLLWQRKTVTKHAWRFCLSFFITENALNLEEIAIKDDIYLAYWTQTLVPIVDKGGVFEKFQKINLTSLSTLSWQERWNHNKQIWNIPSPNRESILWNLFEKFLKTIFLPRTKKSFQKLWKPFWVIISDDMLKFHDKDKRKEIRDFIFS